MRWLVRLPRVIFEVIRDELASSSKVTLDRNENFAGNRNRSYTTLFSYQWRQENKAKLACLASKYQFRFFTIFIYIFHSVPSLATAPKMLVAAYQRHQRWSPQTPIWGGSISWTTNKSASARNTAVAFYPGVYQGVIYISAGKAMSEKIYRLVGELYLDWIFSCINRGKIIIW